MTDEDIQALVAELGLIDLGDAITYLDEEGNIEAAFLAQPVEQTTHTGTTAVRGNCKLIQNCGREKEFHGYVTTLPSKWRYPSRSGFWLA